MRRMFILKFGSEFSARIFCVIMSSNFLAQNRVWSIYSVSLLKRQRMKVRKPFATELMALAR